MNCTTQNEIAMGNTMRELATASENMNPIHAMRLLTKLFVDNCGVSLGYRSVAYYAIWDWLLETTPADIMPLLCEDCTKELLADNDITYIDEEDIVNLTKEMIEQGLDNDTAASLCRGIKTLKEK